MTKGWTRRHLVGSATFTGLAMSVASPFGARAQGSPLLEQLREEGVVRVGLANQPPYSGLRPDGTVTGFVPTLVQRVMAELGVPETEGFVATYGELIPGLQARRWHIIGASLRITAERCQRVLYSDPVTFDGGAFAYVPGEVDNPPQSLSEIGEAGMTIGMLQGSYLLDLAQEQGVDASSISQFPDNPSLIDGLMAGRVPLVVSTNASLSRLQQARGGAFEVIYPIPDDPAVGSGPAFSPQDEAFHAAFQEKLRAMRESGDLWELAAEFGFSRPPEELQGLSAETACERVS